MSEIKRVRGFESGSFNCLKCGKKFHLWFNGGELDSHECCGLTYRTESQAIDLVIYDESDDSDELDATAAPVVVGEDVPAGHVLIGPNIIRFGAGNFDIVKVGQAAADISKALTAALAGDT